MSPSDLQTRRSLSSLSFIYAPVPHAFQMITIHHRAASGILNSHCGLIETNRRFGFPCTELQWQPRMPSRLHLHAGGVGVTVQPGVGRRWNGHGERGFQQGRDARPACSVTHSLPTNAVFTCRPDRQSQRFPAEKVTGLTRVNPTRPRLLCA